MTTESKARLYGLWVLQHHGTNRILTVMSSAGIAAQRAHMAEVDGLEVRAGDGRFTQYVEQQPQALTQLIELHDIEVLSFQAWAEKKAELGDACR